MAITVKTLQQHVKRFNGEMARTEERIGEISLAFVADAYDVVKPIIGDKAEGGKLRAALELSDSNPGGMKRSTLNRHLDNVRRLIKRDTFGPDGAYPLTCGDDVRSLFEWQGIRTLTGLVDWLEVHTPEGRETAEKREARKAEKAEKAEAAKNMSPTEALLTYAVGLFGADADIVKDVAEACAKHDLREQRAAAEEAQDEAVAA